MIRSLYLINEESHNELTHQLSLKMTLTLGLLIEGEIVRLSPRSFQTQTASKYLWKFTTLMVVVFAVFMASYYQYAPLNTVRSYFRDAVSPIAGFFQSFYHSSSRFIEKGKDFFTSYQQLKELKAENVALKKWQYTALALMSENKALRKQVSALPEDLSQPLLTVRLLTAPTLASTQRVIIQGGKKDGIAVGQPVTTSEGLIGRVTEAGDKTSEVLLITDDLSRIPVMLEPSHQQVILSGYQGQYLSFHHLEKEAELQPGSRVFTSGKGGKFPPGLFIGTVQQHYSKLIVQPASDWRKVEYVQILFQPEISMDE